MTKRPYYTVEVDWHSDGNWSPEFGDFVKAVADQEAQDMRHSYGLARRDIRVTKGME